MWLPKIAAPASPKYKAIADALAGDIASGALAPGARLPPQRELADALGVTVGTIGRAYTEARRRGLISGEVGRGTFVCGAHRPPPGALTALSHEEAEGVCQLGLNTHVPPAATFAESLATLAESAELPRALAYSPGVGSERHRRMGAEWLRRTGLHASADDVVVTAGAQHGMLLALSAVTEPGDVIYAEQLTYPGLHAIARYLRLRVKPIAIDGDGLVPDALRAACKDEPGKALYCIPSLHNPTATLMPIERRREIAAIAEEHRLRIVEDDVYGDLLEQPVPPICSLIPELGYYVTSVSKTIAPGLRVGFLRLPPSGLDGVAGVMATTTLMAPSVSAELLWILIERGEADALTAELRAKVARRQATARRHLGDLIDEASHPAAPQVWVNLPDPWRAEEFVAHCRARGVIVASSEPFAVGRGIAPHAVRLSVSAPADDQQLETAIDEVARLLRTAPAALVRTV